MQACPFSFPVPACSLSSMTFKKKTFKHEKWRLPCLELFKVELREFLVPPRCSAGGDQARKTSPCTNTWQRGRDDWDKTLMQGRDCVDLRLCDFSQSRFLINFQTVKVKVRVNTFPDKPAPSTFLAGAAGQLDSHGLIPKPAALHVDLSAGGGRCPPGAPVGWEDGGVSADCLQRCWTEDRLQPHLWILIRDCRQPLGHWWQLHLSLQPSWIVDLGSCDT